MRRSPSGWSHLDWQTLPCPLEHLLTAAKVSHCLWKKRLPAKCPPKPYHCFRQLICLWEVWWESCARNQHRSLAGLKDCSNLNRWAHLVIAIEWFAKMIATERSSSLCRRMTTVVSFSIVNWFIQETAWCPLPLAKSVTWSGQNYPQLRRGPSRSTMSHPWRPRAKLRELAA